MIDWDQALLGPVMDVFGESAVFVPRAGASFTATVVFDEGFDSLDLAGQPGVATDSPVLGVRLSQFLALPLQKDQVVITATAAHAGGTYAIREVQPDSHGWAKLLLNYVGP